MLLHIILLPVKVDIHKEPTINKLLESIDAVIQNYEYCREGIERRLNDAKERLKIGFSALESIVENI